MGEKSCETCMNADCAIKNVPWEMWVMAVDCRLGKGFKHFKPRPEVSP